VPISKFCDKKPGALSHRVRNPAAPAIGARHFDRDAASGFVFLFALPGAAPTLELVFVCVYEYRSVATLLNL
jgi:hypothetical protein